MAKNQKPKKSFSVKIRLPQPHRGIGSGAPPPRTPVHKSHGKSTGLGICQYIALLLEVNETLPMHKKITDKQLARVVIEEYGYLLERKRSSVRRLFNGEIDFGYFRSLYNTGKLTGTKPVIRSNRYDEKGMIDNRRVGRPRKVKRPTEDFDPGQNINHLPRMSWIHPEDAIRQIKELEEKERERDGGK